MEKNQHAGAGKEIDAVTKSIPSEPREQEDEFEKQRQSELGPESSAHTDQKADIVTWDGPDDPEFPQNWPTSIRMGHVSLASGLSLLGYVPFMLDLYNA